MKFISEIDAVKLVNRIKRISIQILEEYNDLFNDNFEGNKIKLGQVTIISSKKLRNKIAGFITNIKKDEQEEKAASEEETSDEILVEEKTEENQD